MFPTFWESWLSRFYQRVKDDPHFSTSNPPNTKLAVIIEPRNMPMLRYVIYNFAYLLLPLGWHFQLFHGTANKTEAELLEKDLHPNLTLTNLHLDNLSVDQYNKLLTTLPFYSQLVGQPEHLLIFQTDCLLLKNTLEPFFQYDMVGAPWNHIYGCNGGFSLRKTEAMKRVIQTNVWQNENEDGYFSHRYASQLSIPDKYTLAKFSMETVWSEDPVGMHKPYAHHEHSKLILLLEKAWNNIFIPCSSTVLLNQIHELGYIQNNNICLPLQTIHNERWLSIEKYLSNYPTNGKLDYYFTLFDGWREHTEPCDKPLFIPLTPGSIGLLEHYKNRGSANEEGRFIPKNVANTIFPVLDKKVLAFGRHKNDPSVLLIPDPEFINTDGYVQLKEEIDRVDIPWEHKKHKIYWRGGLHGMGYKKYGGKSQRQQATEIKWIDAVASYNTSKKEMLEYKYLLDIDGEVNAWSGLWWKLYSKSVVFKVESHYEQWYYGELKAWTHYIPVKGDFSDLESKYSWALQNDVECKKIAEAGKEFTNLRTYSYVVKNYKWD